MDRRFVARQREAHVLRSEAAKRLSILAREAALTVVEYSWKRKFDSQTSVGLHRLAEAARSPARSAEKNEFALYSSRWPPIAGGERFLPWRSAGAQAMRARALLPAVNSCRCSSTTA